jgi:hypothetical protein
MLYELLDLDSCNLVGTYADEDAALLAVLATIQYSGKEAAETLSLASVDPTGATAGELIAQRSDLVNIARSRVFAH